jgi:hypothetical protein
MSKNKKSVFDWIKEKFNDVQEDEEPADCHCCSGTGIGQVEGHSCTNCNGEGTCK